MYTVLIILSPFILKVLGQLDKKFIVTATTVENNKEVIVLFDQHAVHERIRVENLTGGKLEKLPGRQSHSHPTKYISVYVTSYLMFKMYLMFRI